MRIAFILALHGDARLRSVLSDRVAAWTRQANPQARRVCPISAVRIRPRADTQLWNLPYSEQSSCACSPLTRPMLNKPGQPPSLDAGCAPFLDQKVVGTDRFCWRSLSGRLPPRRRIGIDVLGLMAPDLAAKAEVCIFARSCLYYIAGTASNSDICQ